MNKSFSKLSLIILAFLLSLSNQIVSQEAFKPIIKAQAEKLSKAVFNEDWESLVKHTHPAIVRVSGGKDVMIEVVKKSMTEMKRAGAEFESFEILDSIVVSKYEDEHHCLVPKIMTMKMGETTIIAKSYLFGFSDLSGETWTFVEADKLISDVGKMFFPSFKTNITIPPKPDPVVIDDWAMEEEEVGKLEIRLNWDKTKISFRHELEVKLDKLLREKELGYCFGGENGENEEDYVMVNLEVAKDSREAVLTLLGEHISPAVYGEYEVNIFEK